MDLRNRSRAVVAGAIALLLATVMPLPAAALDSATVGDATADVATQDSGEPQDEATLRQYHVQFIDIDVAAHLASQVCQTFDREECRYGMVSDRLLDLIANPLQHSEFAGLLAERDVPPASQSFQVIILSAHRAAGESDELPAGARTALDDVADFLPFRSYHLVDTGWIRTARQGNITLGEGGAFAASLYFKGGTSSNDHLLIEGFELQHRRTGRSEDGEVVYRSDWREVLSSTFGIDVGETVVVGTSKLNGGDEALVVLLTAVR